MKNIAIFASGTGTNADQIIRYFKDNPGIAVPLVISDNKKAGVKMVAAEHGVSFHHVPYTKIKDKEFITNLLTDYQIDFLVLAGFMRLIPDFLVEKYKDHILNIHPALLPKYGGKGMYGQHVHEAVKAANEGETGITIHLVNDRYDEGKILFQKPVSIFPEDSVQEIAQKVHTLEHKYYPKVIHAWILDQSN